MVGSCRSRSKNPSCFPTVAFANSPAFISVWFFIYVPPSLFLSLPLVYEVYIFLILNSQFPPSPIPVLCGNLDCEESSALCSRRPGENAKPFGRGKKPWPRWTFKPQENWHKGHDKMHLKCGSRPRQTLFRILVFSFVKKNGCCLDKSRSLFCSYFLTTTRLVGGRREGLSRKNTSVLFIG